ncbi:MAG: type III pantothenate kinase [Phycisphaerales bacterium JB040]
MPQHTTDADPGHANAPDLRGPPCLIAVAVGNSRTRVGLFHHSELEQSESFENDRPEAIAGAIAELYNKEATDRDPVVVVASTRPSVSGPLIDRLTGVLPGAPYLVGKDLPIHVNHLLDEDGARTVGHDRLLNALGAFSRTGQATVVVDLGTAATVDFVDGKGTFCGGAIAPGLRMMLASLHEHAEQLPIVEYRPVPSDRPFGLNTPDAIRLGVGAALQGLVRALTERYALSYGGYPQIVATGGDLAVLEADGVVEHFVPDLQLIGIQVACARALAEADDDA